MKCDNWLGYTAAFPGANRVDKDMAAPIVIVGQETC